MRKVRDRLSESYEEREGEREGERQREKVKEKEIQREKEREREGQSKMLILPDPNTILVALTQNILCFRAL